MRDIPRTAFLIIMDAWMVAALLMILSACAITPASQGSTSSTPSSTGAAERSFSQWRSGIDNQFGPYR